MFPAPTGRNDRVLLTPFQGFPAQDCLFPGAMPQAFTWCRVAAKHFGHASRSDGTKTGSTNHPSKHNFCAARSHPTFSVNQRIGRPSPLLRKCKLLNHFRRITGPQGTGEALRFAFDFDGDLKPRRVATSVIRVVMYQHAKVSGRRFSCRPVNIFDRSLGRWSAGIHIDIQFTSTA